MVLKFNISKMINSLETVSRIRDIHEELTKEEMKTFERKARNTEVMDVILFMEYLQDGVPYSIEGDNVFFDFSRKNKKHGINLVG